MRNVFDFYYFQGSMTNSSTEEESYNLTSWRQDAFVESYFSITCCRGGYPELEQSVQGHARDFHVCFILEIFPEKRIWVQKNELREFEKKFPNLDLVLFDKFKLEKYFVIELKRTWTNLKRVL